jgi:hypothetical protein
MPAKKINSSKPKPKKTYYYRIFFDDNESKNYMKSKLTHKQVEKYLKAYEKTHEKFINKEFVDYLKKYDRTAELIEISDISY